MIKANESETLAKFGMVNVVAPTVWEVRVMLTSCPFVRSSGVTAVVANEVAVAAPKPRTFPPANVKEPAAWVSVILPALKLMTAPEARKRSDHILVTDPNAAPSEVPKSKAVLMATEARLERAVFAPLPAGVPLAKLDAPIFWINSPAPEVAKLFKAVVTAISLEVLCSPCTDNTDIIYRPVESISFQDDPSNLFSFFC